MKEILILSGKGGTGKTSVTCALGFFVKENDVLVDCDVDAADMHILLNPDFSEKHEFHSGKECEVDENKCTLCGVCADNCHYNAISLSERSAVINKTECESCLLCYRLCPEDAIKAEDSHCGEYYVSNTRINRMLVHARLKSGADNSGKLVSTVRTLAKQKANESGADLILIDGPPGIGCPVIAAMTGVGFVVLVSEPTVSGFSDLKRIVELIAHFKIKAGCIINKSTVNEELKKEIKSFCMDNNVELLGEIPYTKKFYKALVEKKSVIETDENLKEKFKDIWEKINSIIK
jgi:MinD superfamily P-loop ATPase